MKWKMDIWMVGCVALLTLAGTADGVNRYVDNANCPGPGDGTQGDPFCTIQPGMDVGTFA